LLASFVAKIAELLVLTAFTPTPLFDVPNNPYDDVEVPLTPVPLALVPATPGPVLELVPTTQPEVAEHATDVMATPIALAAAGDTATALAPKASPRPRPALTASGVTIAGRMKFSRGDIDVLLNYKAVPDPAKLPGRSLDAKEPASGKRPNATPLRLDELRASLASYSKYTSRGSKRSPSMSIAA
jgi:hypothetical protein